MNLIADESVDAEIISRLRQNGIKVISIAEELPSITDKEVLQIAYKNKDLLITEDKDFGELAYRLKFKHHGILLIRLNDIPRNDRINMAVEIIQKHFKKLEKNFSVLNKTGLRIKTAQNIK